jgi:hypothetical protein
MSLSQAVLANAGITTTEAPSQSQVTEPTINAESQAPKEGSPAIEAKPTEEPKQDTGVSSKFAALAKKEKAVRAKQSEIQSKEQALAEKEAKLAAMEAKINGFEEAKAQAKKNPLKYLQETGLTYDDIVQAQLNELQEDPALMEVKTKLDAMEKAQKDAELKAAEDEKRRIAEEENKVYEGYKAKIKAHVSGKDEYELINTYNQHNLVFDTIRDFFDAKGRVISIDEAAQLVEKYLEGEVEQQLTRAQQLKRFQTKFQPQAQAQAQEEKPTTLAQAVGKSGYKPVSQVKTLNNSMAGSSQPKSEKMLSPEEARKRAIAKLQGKL